MRRAVGADLDRREVVAADAAAPVTCVAARRARSPPGARAGRRRRPRPRARIATSRLTRPSRARRRRSGAATRARGESRSRPTAATELARAPRRSPPRSWPRPARPVRVGQAAARERTSWSPTDVEPRGTPPPARLGRPWMARPRAGRPSGPWCPGWPGKARHAAMTARADPGQHDQEAEAVRPRTQSLEHHVPPRVARGASDPALSAKRVAARPRPRRIRMRIGYVNVSDTYVYR